MKKIHMGKLVDEHGNVSASCFDTARPINLTIASWTTRPQAVTCPKCLRILNAQSQPSR